MHPRKMAEIAIWDSYGILWDFMGFFGILADVCPSMVSICGTYTILVPTAT